MLNKRCYKMLTDFNRDLELIKGLETDYLKILYYDLAPMIQDYKTYEYARLCTIVEGSIHVSVDKDIHFMQKPGQFILMPPYSIIHMDIDVPTKAFVIELKDKLLKSVTDKISLDIDTEFDSIKEGRIFLSQINEELIPCLNRLNDISINPDKNKEFLLDLHAQELVYHLIKIKGIQKVINLKHDHPIYKSIKYIQENLKNQISINKLANDVNMSESNFCNSFKKIIGMTPKEYITNLKLSKAKEMLKNQNVTEVAYDLGYDSISHFIAIFKNKYGMTPKQYKSIVNAPVIYKY